MDINKGTVIFQGKKYTLTQKPYLAGNKEHPYYTASAVDAEETTFIVIWKHKPGEAEDWDHPYAVEKVLHSETTYDV